MNLFIDDEDLLDDDPEEFEEWDDDTDWDDDEFDPGFYRDEDWDH